MLTVIDHLLIKHKTKQLCEKKDTGTKRFSSKT